MRGRDPLDALQALSLLSRLAYLLSSYLPPHTRAPCRTRRGVRFFIVFMASFMASSASKYGTICSTLSTVAIIPPHSKKTVDEIGVLR